jgi:PmbA protein
MNRKERLELAKWTIQKARGYGADDVAVDVSRKRDINIEYRGGQLDKLQDATESKLSLDLYVNNRFSSYTTNDMHRDSLDRFLGEAVAMTKYLNEDPYHTLPDPKYYEGRQNIDLNIFDPGYESVASDERIAIARKMESTARAQSENVVACTSYYNDTISESIKVHSNGFEGDTMSTSFEIQIEVTVCDDKECRPNDFDSRKVRHFKELPDPEVLSINAVKRAFKKIGQIKLDSGRYDMVVENRARTSLLRALYRAMQGRSLQQKSSFLEGKIGQKIASEKLTIIDDPFVKSGLGSQLYDSQGLTAKRRVMIDKGMLNSYYIGCYYGKKLGLEPNGGSATNLVFDYGDNSLDDLIGQMTKGILVTGFIGGNSNSTTGDFSFGIVGFYVEDGQIVKPVNEMNVSGNMNEFWHKLVATGDDPYVYSSWRRPSMYFKDIQFSGV